MFVCFSYLLLGLDGCGDDGEVNSNRYYLNSPDTTSIIKDNKHGSMDHIMEGIVFLFLLTRLLSILVPRIEEKSSKFCYLC